MKPSRTVCGFKNMTNTGISFELSTEVFSSLFMQIVRIPMTLGCNPMIRNDWSTDPYIKFSSNTNSRSENAASDEQLVPQP